MFSSAIAAFLFFREETFSFFVKKILGNCLSRGSRAPRGRSSEQRGRGRGGSRDLQIDPKGLNLHERAKSDQLTAGKAVEALSAAETREIRKIQISVISTVWQNSFASSMSPVKKRKIEAKEKGKS